MVSLETHLEKNHEFQSITIEYQKKDKTTTTTTTTSQKLKMLGPLSNQTVNLKTDTKTLLYSILKLKYSPSILKAQ